jgi:putative ABC transport system substrate-binding protein
MTVTIGRRELLVALGGTAAAWPLAARAAPPARPVTIGVIAPSIPAAEGLRQGFHELGYVEGRNLRLEYRWILGVHHRYAAMIFAGMVGSDEGRR